MGVKYENFVLSMNGCVMMRALKNILLFPNLYTYLFYSLLSYPPKINYCFLKKVSLTNTTSFYVDEFQ